MSYEIVCDDVMEWAKNYDLILHGVHVIITA